jgi:hypothetical protein
MGGALRGWRSRLWATLGLFVGGSLLLGTFLATLANRWPWYYSLATALTIALSIPIATVVIWISWGRTVRQRVRQWFSGPCEMD